MKKQSVSTIIAAGLLLCSSSIMATPLPELYLAALGTISVATNIKDFWEHGLENYSRLKERGLENYNLQKEHHRKEALMRPYLDYSTIYGAIKSNFRITHPYISIICLNKYLHAGCAADLVDYSSSLPIKIDGNDVTAPLIEPNDFEQEADYKKRFNSQIPLSLIHI